MNPRVAIFARAPVLGAVKTRLARAVGDAEALRTYLTLAEDTCAALSGADAFDAELWLAGPRTPVVDAWARRFGFAIREQRGADLGARMLHAFLHGVSVIVGTDIPGLTSDYVASALAGLGKGKLVLGPTEDGGYCLIALGQAEPELFRDIAWSTDAVLRQTLARADGAGLDVVLLERLWDVDDASGYERWIRGGPRTWPAAE